MVEIIEDIENLKARMYKLEDELKKLKNLSCSSCNRYILGQDEFQHEGRFIKLTPVCWSCWYAELRDTSKRLKKLENKEIN